MSCISLVPFHSILASPFSTCRTHSSVLLLLSLLSLLSTSFPGDRVWLEACWQPARGPSLSFQTPGNQSSEPRSIPKDRILGRLPTLLAATDWWTGPLLHWAKTIFQPVHTPIRHALVHWHQNAQIHSHPHTASSVTLKQIHMNVFAGCVWVCIHAHMVQHQWRGLQRQTAESSQSHWERFLSQTKSGPPQSLTVCFKFLSLQCTHPFTGPPHWVCIIQQHNISPVYPSLCNPLQGETTTYQPTASKLDRCNRSEQW